MTTTDTEVRLAKLESRVDALEKGRSGRRGKPILCSVEGICGVDPSRDSETCEDASLYRRQKGCLGAGCVKKSAEYYADYRNAPAKVTVRRRGSRTV